MRYFIAFFCLSSIIAGCSPTTTDTNTFALDSLQYKKNISMLYGSGSKITTGSNGKVLASNIIWKDSNGITQSLDSVRGKKVLVSFWATWCVPCDQEMPGLVSIAETMKPDVVVIGVSIDQDPSTFPTTFEFVQEFAKSRNMSFQVVLDETEKVYSNYGGSGNQIPWTFVIDRDGVIIQKFVGATTKDQFVNVLNQIP